MPSPTRPPCRPARPFWNTDVPHCWQAGLSWYGEGARPAWLRRDSVGLQVRLQGGRDREAAIGSLIRLHQSDKKPRQRRAAAIEDVRESVFSGRGFVPQIHAPRLEIFAIRAARDLQITPLPWRPDFDVVS